MFKKQINVNVLKVEKGEDYTVIYTKEHLYNVEKLAITEHLRKIAQPGQVFFRAVKGV